MLAPVLIKPIPTQVINEQAAYAPFDLKSFIHSPDEPLSVNFSAELSDGKSLPKGMICTTDGILTGIPAKGTQGNYEIMLTAENAAGKIETKFFLTIKPSLIASNAEYLDKIKTQIWQALEQNLPLPELDTLYQQAVTPGEVYYLLERWAIIIAWDAFNLEPPGPKKLLTLAGSSPHYHVYDRGSCIIAVPKDLYSYERTLFDGLQTAKALAREVFKKGWTIELSGFDKLMRGFWVEIQHLGDKHAKRLEILNFDPTPDDVKLYLTEAQHLSLYKSENLSLE